MKRIFALNAGICMFFIVAMMIIFFHSDAQAVSFIATKNFNIGTYPSSLSSVSAGDFNGDGKTDIDDPAGWSMTTGSSTVVIDVIDTGIDYNHQGIAENTWVNNFFN